MRYAAYGDLNAIGLWACRHVTGQGVAGHHGAGSRDGRAAFLLPRQIGSDRPAHVHACLPFSRFIWLCCVNETQHCGKASGLQQAQAVQYAESLDMGRRVREDQIEKVENDINRVGIRQVTRERERQRQRQREREGGRGREREGVRERRERQRETETERERERE